MSMLSTLKRRVSGILQVKKTLWKGTIIAAPILILLWIVYAVLNAVNSIGEKALDLFVPERYIVLGMGLLFILFFILLMGRIEVHYEAREKSIWQTIKKNSVGKIPFFGSFLAGANRKVISLDGLRNLTPCKFWLSDTTPHYGFIMNQQKVRGAETELDVYRPNVPTIVPGDLFPLKRRFVIKLGNSSAEILDKLASGGFISSKEEIPIPWEDETEEGFRERINLTPLEIAIKRIIEGKFNNPSQGAD
jgi:uncharacterized membrane protein